MFINRLESILLGFKSHPLPVVNLTPGINLEARKSAISLQNIITELGLKDK